MTKLSFTWSSRREGNDGYVLEESELLKIKREYGPLPCDEKYILAFIEGRRRIVAMMAEKAKLEYCEPESFDYLATDKPKN